MNTPYMNQFIAQENLFAAVFKEKVYDPDNLSRADLQELADRLGNKLSPENLTCDGELRGAKLRAKAKLLNGAKADLMKLGITSTWW